MSNIEKQIEQQVDQLVDYVYRHKNQGMQVVFKASKYAIEIEPLDRPEKKPDAVKEFFKNVIEGLGPRMPSTSGIVETSLYFVHGIKAFERALLIRYIKEAEESGCGYGEENPYYDSVKPELREMAKKGLIKF